MSRERIDPFERAILTVPDGVRIHRAFDLKAMPPAARLKLAKRTLPTDCEPLIGFNDVLMDQIRLRIGQRIALREYPERELRWAKILVGRPA